DRIDKECRIAYHHPSRADKAIHGVTVVAVHTEFANRLRIFHAPREPRIQTNKRLKVIRDIHAGFDEMLALDYHSNRSDVVGNWYLPDPSARNRQRVNMSVGGRLARASIYSGEPAVHGKLAEIRIGFHHIQLPAKHGLAACRINDDT